MSCKPGYYHFALSAFSLFILLLVSSGCKGKESARPTENPRIAAGQDSLVDTPVAERVFAHFELMYGMGPDAEANYQRSLAALRKDAEEVVDFLSGYYEKAEPIAYADRMAALQTLSELEVPEALESLLKYARQELPQRSPSGEGLSPYNEESSLRMIAIDGVARLSKDHEAALKEMPGFFKHPDPVIRLDAMNRFADVIRTVEDKNKRERMIALFPTDYQYDPSPDNPGPAKVDK